MATLYYRPSSALLGGEDSLPDFKDLDNVLPEYRYIFKDAREHEKPAKERIKSEPIDEETKDGMLHYQREELNRYREATHKMGVDIISLNRQLGKLKLDRNRLQQQRDHTNDVTKLVKDTVDFDGMSMAELLENYISLRRHFNIQTNQLRNYKERIQDVQNQLIKRNDQVAELLKVRNAHEAQSLLIQDLRKKVTKLKKIEEVCRRQEKVIEKLEEKSTYDNHKDSKLNRILSEENQNLRNDIKLLKDDINSRDDNDTDDIKEKFILQEQIDSSDSRISILEQQMMENAREWAREKTDLKQRLLERTGVFHDPDILDPSYILKKRPEPLELLQTSRRFSKAPHHVTRHTERKVWPLDRYYSGRNT